MRRTAVLLAAALLLLAGCGDEGSKEGDKDPIEVQLGDAFTWNGYSVEEGWSLEQQEMNRAGEPGTMPVVKAVVRNDGDELRVTLFSINFVKDDSLVASVYCTSPKLKPGDSLPIECGGMSSSYPEDYDQITVSEVRRD